MKEKIYGLTLAGLLSACPNNDAKIVDREITILRPEGCIKKLDIRYDPNYSAKGLYQVLCENSTGDLVLFYRSTPSDSWTKLTVK